MAEDFIKDYISACSYVVCINQILLGFSKISGLMIEMDAEVYQEGGRGSLPYIMKKKDTGNKILTLEKGISKSDQMVLLFAQPGKHIQDMMILVRKGVTAIDKVFYIEEAVVTKAGYSDLDAGSGSILMGTFELSHSGLVEMAGLSEMRHLW